MMTNEKRQALIERCNKHMAWLMSLTPEAFTVCNSVKEQLDIYGIALEALTAEREYVRAEHADWSEKTFGSVGPVGPLKHLSKEALEAAAQPDDLSEWADMQFLLWDAQRRAGITDEQITLAMIEKLEVNKARHWPDPKDGEPRLHIKAESDNTAQQYEELAASKRCVHEWRPSQGRTASGYLCHKCGDYNGPEAAPKPEGQ